MTARVISLILTALFLFSSFPLSVVAESETTEISEVTIDGIRAPVVGENVGTYRQNMHDFAKLDNSHIGIDYVGVSDGMNEFDSSSSFVADEYFFLIFVLKCGVSYHFAEDCTAVIDDALEVISWLDGNDLYVGVVYVPVEKDAPVISELSIKNVFVPTAGTDAVYYYALLITENIVPEFSHYGVELEDFFIHESADDKKMFEGDFEAGKTYYLRILLETDDDDYVFSDNCKITANVGEIVEFEIADDGDEAMVLISFTIPDMPISFFSISGLRSPIPGESVDDYFYTIPHIFTSNENVVLEGCGFVTEDGKSLDYTDRFVLGNTYYMTIYFQPVNGYQFDENCLVDVDDGEIIQTIVYDDGFIGLVVSYTAGVEVKDVSVTAHGSVPFSVNGQKITIRHDLACKVGYVANGEYVTVDSQKNSNGTFSYTLPEEVTEAIIAVCGDADNDGRIDSRDLDKLMAYINFNPDEINVFAADVNNDGKVNNKDYGLIQRYLNGWSIEFI